MIPAADLREAISVEAIVQRYGLRVRRRGSQYRLAECPRCHERSRREAIAIDVKSGRWIHHGHEKEAGGECSGDILSLLAACEGLDCGRDFRRVAELAAEIGGLSSSEADREELRRRAAERARQEIVADLEQRVANRNTADARWRSLPRYDVRGQAYLASRSLDPVVLIARDCARFSPDGIAVAIRDADGVPLSIATRRYGDAHPKVLALRDHSTRGTFIDCASSIRGDTDTFVVEGVVDSLTARLAWPDAIVLGVNGAGAIAKTVESIIGRVRIARCRLFLVPHDDEEGIRATTRAGQIALAAGLDLGETLHVVALPAKDLNAAWSSGWRP